MEIPDVAVLTTFLQARLSCQYLCRVYADVEWTDIRDNGFHRITICFFQMMACLTLCYEALGKAKLLLTVQIAFIKREQ